MSNNLITAVLGILFFLNLRTYAFAQKRISMYILFSSFLVSGILGILVKIEFESIFRCMCLVLLVISFPFNFNWNNKYFYFLLLAAGIYLVALQVGNAFGIGFLENFISRYYPAEHNLWDEEAVLINSISDYASQGSFRRYGGVFYNPNVMGQMMVFWYIIMRNFSPKAQQLTIAVICIALISILLSGSRTAFVAFFIYNGALYWNILKRKGFILGMGVMSLAILLLLNISSLGVLRILNITQGVTSKEGSGAIKLATFNNWLGDQFVPSNFDLTKFLFGNLQWDAFFDNDPGYILNFFGFGGAIFLLYFLYDVYKNSTKRGKYNFSLLFIGLGATIIMNFRFSILFFLILSIGYNRLVTEKTIRPER